MSYSIMPQYLQVYCTIILYRDLRRSTGAIGDTLTQFHAWWHLFAGMGTYMHLIVR